MNEMSAAIRYKETPLYHTHAWNRNQECESSMKGSRVPQVDRHHEMIVRNKMQSTCREDPDLNTLFP